MNNNNKLKAYIRFDGSGRVIPGSLLLQRFKPKSGGKWQEIDAYECCNYTITTTTTATPTTTTTTTTISCICYSVQEAGGVIGASYSYIDCNGIPVVDVPIGEFEVINVCALLDSITSATELTILSNGACGEFCPPL